MIKYVTVLPLYTDNIYSHPRLNFRSVPNLPELPVHTTFYPGQRGVGFLLMIITVRVTPGEHNLGIFINLNSRGNESYRLTHPAASLGGLLRGILSDNTISVCVHSNLQAIRISQPIRRGCLLRDLPQNKAKGHSALPRRLLVG